MVGEKTGFNGDEPLNLGTVVAPACHLQLDAPELVGLPTRGQQLLHDGSVARCTCCTNGGATIRQRIGPRAQQAGRNKRMAVLASQSQRRG